MLVENMVQATARDLLASAMLRLEAADYRITMHTHHELVVEVPRGFDAIEDFKQLMEITPRWATGLPIACEVWGPNQRYQK
jgi:DNA polymerase bacteriophage-type